MFFIYILFLVGVGCHFSDKGVWSSSELHELVIGTDGRYEKSTTAGSFAATAIKRYHELDVVFYPVGLLVDESYALLRPSLEEEELDRLLGLYPQGTKDQFLVGTMKGSNIKKFVLNRIESNYSAELDVAGLNYDIGFTGGKVHLTLVSLEDGRLVEDDRYYKVAISRFFYFSGATFPSYKYGSNLNFMFRMEDRMISARESIRNYLEQITELPLLTQSRARVTKTVLGDKGVLPISQIQGKQFLSPVYGYKVTTQGIITAVAVNDWYPGGVSVYIQSDAPDDDPRTSEGLHLHLTQKTHLNFGSDNKIELSDRFLKRGDLVLVKGVVYETMTQSGLSRTGLNEVEEVIVLKREQDLPEPILLRRKGVKGVLSNSNSIRNQLAVIPRKVSTYRGDLNLKPTLEIETDAIDFYESLEGMRVKFFNPRVVGFLGGKESFEDRSPKRYLNLYVLPDGFENSINDTLSRGVFVDEKTQDYNPEILLIATHHLSLGLKTDNYYRVGDTLCWGENTEGDQVPVHCDRKERADSLVEGILAYDKNLFGDGNYTIFIPDRDGIFSQSLFFDENSKIDYSPVSGNVRLKRLVDYGPTHLVSELDNHLTVATYNVENLAENSSKVQSLAKSISYSLQCPDIISLVEIQDFNGTDFIGDSSADLTLKKLIDNIDSDSDCSGRAIDYQSINIDPIFHQEGGQPGGNIRVALIYNRAKVKFNLRPIPNSLSETRIMENGSINYNPGRIFPKDSAFDYTRKSIVAEFNFLGEQIFVIGNHFNSKLGDSSIWGSVQPPFFQSESKRARMASKIVEFVGILKQKNPKAHVIVLGDFNSFMLESPMQIFKTQNLQNLALWKKLVPKNDRYTTNYNGNSQSLDYIFVDPLLLKKNPELHIMHINSDFMYRLSDHDPIVSRFEF